MGKQAIAVVDHAQPLTAVQIKAQIQRIQQVMKAVMKDGTHYGKIPGAGDRKSLFKPGAEVLGATFRVAPTYRIEDLSDDDSIRYRAACVGTHQTTGVVLGEGMGSASSNEEKYKWRAAVCDAEFDETPEDRRRVKWKRSQQGEYQVQQIRTEPADIDNTVLKMACKRAQVAMIINVTGASDIFAQDLEDLPEGLDQVGNGGQRQTRGKPRTNAPQAKAAQPPAGDGPRKVTESQSKLLNARMQTGKVDARQFCEHFKIEAVVDLPFESMDAALAWINANGA